MELQGTVHTVGQIESKGANNFQICEILLDRSRRYQGQTYPNFTKIVLQGKKTELVKEKNPEKGDYVKVQGDIQGRFFINEGAGKHAQDFVAWSIEIIRKNSANETTQNAAAPQTQPANPYE